VRIKASRPRLCQRLNQANEASHSENPIVQVSCRKYGSKFIEKWIIITQLLVYPVTIANKLMTKPIAE